MSRHRRRRAREVEAVEELQLNVAVQSGAARYASSVNGPVSACETGDANGEEHAREERRGGEGGVVVVESAGRT